MKILISVLLGGLLLVESAQSWQCLTCAGVNDLKLCQTTTCNPGVSLCSKTVLTAQDGSNTKLYMMGCATSCEDVKDPLFTILSLGFKVDMSCCNTELCNGVNGVGGVRGNPWALAGALFLSLGLAFLWVGL